MDDIDARIVDRLQSNGRATQQELARAVGLSQPAVAERIHKLEEQGIITGYVARVDAAKLGIDVTAFVGVGIDHPKFFDHFVKKVTAIPEVLECHRVAGPDAFLLKVKTESTSTLDRLLVENLRTIPGVTRTQTTVVLTSMKEDTHVPVALPSKRG